MCISPMEHNNDWEKVCIRISAENWKQRLYNNRHSFSHDLESKLLYLNIFGTLRIKG